MPDQRLALTDKILIGMPFARRGQIVVRDTEQPGFAVRIGASTKTFIIQADLRRDDGTRPTIKMKVCEVGELNTRAARAKARGLLLLIAAGEDPRPKKKVEILAAAKAAEKAEDEAARAAPLGVPTLREAWSRFRVSHLERKQRSPATIRGYTDHMERLFADWLDRPLSELGDEPRLLADRHDLISANNGPAIANGAMRTFRAVYNHARKTCRALPPENPAAAVDWNPEKRKDTAMGVIDLPGWFEQLARITKARVLEDVTGATNAEEADRIAGFKKGDMAEAAERLVEGKGWLPAVLRTEPAVSEAEGEAAPADGEGEATDADAYPLAAE